MHPGHGAPSVVTMSWTWIHLANAALALDGFLAFFTMFLMYMRWCAGWRKNCKTITINHCTELQKFKKHLANVATWQQCNRHGLTLPPGSLPHPDHCHPDVFPFLGCWSPFCIWKIKYHPANLPTISCDAAMCSLKKKIKMTTINCSLFVVALPRLAVGLQHCRFWWPRHRQG